MKELKDIIKALNLKRHGARIVRFFELSRVSFFDTFFYTLILMDAFLLTFYGLPVYLQT